MRARVLIVEDESIVATDLRECLEGFGHEVVGMCRYGEKAPELAQELAPDVVLMDIHLAGNVDGTAAAKRIRAETDAAVVYLTAYADEETFEVAQGARPQAYLVKPYEEDTLRTTVETAMRRRLEAVEDARRLRINEQMLEHLTDLVIIARADGTVESLNPPARAAIGHVASLADLPGDVDPSTDNLPAGSGGRRSRGTWDALISSSPRQWRLRGKPYTASASPVEDAFVVVLTPGFDTNRHHRRAHATLTTIQLRAGQLI